MVRDGAQFVARVNTLLADPRAASVASAAATEVARSLAGAADRIDELLVPWLVERNTSAT